MGWLMNEMTQRKKENPEHDYTNIHPLMSC